MVQPTIQMLLNSHPASRLLAGCCLLILAITTRSPWLSAFLLMLSAIMISLLEAGWQSIIRVLRLLRWFIVPIFLLHALLSPGQLLWPGTSLPVTLEGIYQGLWLSIHFATIFIAAMLLFRLLLRSEWLRGMLSIPVLGRRLAIYLLMVTAMRKNVSEQLGHMRQLWRLRPDWRSSALFVLAAFRSALSIGREQAWMLWLRWPESREAICLDSTPDMKKRGSSLVSSIAWLLVGIAALMLAGQ